MPFRLQTYPHTVVVRWIGTPETGEPSSVFAAVAAEHDRSRRTLLYIAIHDLDSREPTPEARDEALRGWRDHSHRISRAYFVMASSSIVASVQLSYYRGMALLGRLRGVPGMDRIRWVSSIDAALDSSQLPMPPAAFRAHLISDGLINAE